MSDITGSEERTGRRPDVLRALKAATAPMSIVEIADELGVHPNTVRFHLGVLLAEGRVRHVAPDRKRPGRPPLLFEAIRQMDPGGQRHYQLLAEILTMGFAADPDPAAKARATGRAWAKQLQEPAMGDAGPEEAISRLLGVLDELGFEPERRGQTELGLRHCPFLELAETRGAVVCPIHLGLMQGALEAWNSPVSVDRLEAFVEPDLCLTHLTVHTGPGAAT
ncbi:helix-turn-helix domain-containing protein [Mycobacterium sp.]|uniref:helix-turn-helix transcriptional regulator n=1 Tax=Mycobacterium sp. TaxID=1785 RepID=UPI0031E0381E